MSIFGFSHIVTEVKDLRESETFYEQLGYERVYAFKEKVLPAKQSILYAAPTEVDLVYLRNPKRPSIGIELIRHSNNRPAKPGQYLSYAWSNPGLASSLAYDPQGNALLALNALASEGQQHIFIPVASLELSTVFYQAAFNFQTVPMSGVWAETYKQLYGATQAIALQLPTCLSQNWSVILHLVETAVPAQRFLNDCGFSCFCLLVDALQYEAFIKQGLDIIGPFEGQKTVQGKATAFTIGFIKDPDGFLVEFYIQGRKKL